MRDEVEPWTCVKVPAKTHSDSPPGGHNRGGRESRRPSLRSPGMPPARRSRPTIRCLVDDLDVELPGLDVDLGEVEHALREEFVRLAPESPTGQKRILSIEHPLVYRLRVSSHRGATWVDEPVVETEDAVIVWLCAAHNREAGSDDDAYVYFAELHASDELLPDDDDRLRDRAEAAIRLYRGLSADLILLLDAALAGRGTEQRAEGIEEIWCALSVRGKADDFISQDLRDLLFVKLEEHVAPAVFETRNDWPTGEVEWFEVVRLGMR
jgi:hypothetical protein